MELGACGTRFKLGHIDAKFLNAKCIRQSPFDAAFQRPPKRIGVGLSADLACNLES